MKVVIFGLSISSSWGNGHATLWRGLCNALAKGGHSVIFFERDVPYYASTRDLYSLPNGTLILYKEWNEVAAIARRELSGAELAVVSSFCPDAIVASKVILDSTAQVRCFYDLDSPVTLAAIERAEVVSYIGPRGLGDFDLILSYAGGPALQKLQTILGAHTVAPLYGSVDPSTHHPVEPVEQFRSHLSYLGTYAADRQERLESLFVEPARQRPTRRFVIGGSMYDDRFPWQPNIHLVRHLPPADHSAFYCSSLLTLNISRQAMFENGYCPSGRLFEAAACGVPILSDNWPGISLFFAPESEILVAEDTASALEALDRSPEDLANLARLARARVMEQHTAAHRVQELEGIMNTVRQRTPAEAQ
ncbi:MAG TPA: glycosyltransferase [Bryobacteraceae bacterium]|jgi:spore maturation protein CgeB|nr:glycosyltransferase [Bryobacteraceae bacterium]